MKKKSIDAAVWLYIMRISSIQLFLAILLSGVSWAKTSEAQRVLDRTISIKVENTYIKQVLSEIECQANVKFVYSSSLINSKRKVSVALEKGTVQEALSKILDVDKLDFKVSGRQIILKPTQGLAIIQTGSTAKLIRVRGTDYLARDITGKVTDPDGAGLPGVSVILKGTNKGTTSDGTGNYTISVPDGSATLVFSFVGFATREFVVAADKAVLDVVLTEDDKALSEVVVIGYGTSKKKDLTGSVAVVNVGQLKEQPNANLSNLLQGRAAGVTVIGSGQPGEPPQVRIRGINTFGNNTPLFVVDGIPADNVRELNANDISSMQVLKDAGAASIYGSRAANGVVIITTKKGSGKIKVSYDAFFGTQRPPQGNVYDLLDTRGMADLKWLALKNSGITPNDLQYGSGATPTIPHYIVPTGAMQGEVDESLYNVDPFFTDPAAVNSFYRIVKANQEGTDWFHEVFKPAPMHSHNITVSGGGEQGNYLLSFNYFDHKGTLLNTYLKRYTLRSNTQFNVNKRIRLGENLALTFMDNPRSGILQEGGGIGMAYRMQPIIPVYDIQGNYAGSFGAGLGNAKNPVAIRERAVNNRGIGTSIFGNVYAEADITNDLSLRSTFGGQMVSGYANSFQYPEYENSENTTTNAYNESSYFGFNWTWSNVVTYEKNLNDVHNFKVMAGTEAYSNKGRNLNGQSLGYFSFDPNFTNLTTASGTRNNGSSRYEDALFSYFGRLDYSLLDRYLIGFTLRQDGSSKFINTRYGLFPAVSAAWRVSEENFMNAVEWIDDLKVRGGYGIMGNQVNVTSGNAFTTYGGNRSHSFYDIRGTGSSTIQGFQRTYIGNPAAIWEKNINFNVGFDATLLNGKLDLVVDYYQKDIKDLLFQVPLAAVVGQGTAPFVNIGGMSNKGLDLSINSYHEFSRDLKLDATLTLTSYNNKITQVSDGIDYFDQEGRRFNGATIVRNGVGHSIGQFFGYQIEGFWNSEAEIQAANQRAATSENPDAVYQSDVKVGRFRYKDINDDGVITAADRTFLGNPNPKFSYGLNLQLNYKNWDLGMFLYGTQGNDIWNNLKWWHDFYTNFAGAKSHTALYDSWTPQHTNAKAPIQENTGSFSTTDVPNSYYIENGSYLRARNAQLGYTFPTDVLDKLRIKGLRVYVQGTNLFTITKYSGMDPEVGQSQVAGSTAFGLDEGVYPNNRQFLFGLNLSF